MFIFELKANVSKSEQDDSSKKLYQALTDDALTQAVKNSKSETTKKIIADNFWKICDAYGGLVSVIKVLLHVQKSEKISNADAKGNASALIKYWKDVESNVKKQLVLFDKLQPFLESKDESKRNGSIIGANKIMDNLLKYSGNAENLDAALKFIIKIPVGSVKNVQSQSIRGSKSNQEEMLKKSAAFFIGASRDLSLYTYMKGGIPFLREKNSTVGGVKVFGVKEVLEGILPNQYIKDSLEGARFAFAHGKWFSMAVVSGSLPKSIILDGKEYSNSLEQFTGKTGFSSIYPEEGKTPVENRLQNVGAQNSLFELRMAIPTEYQIALSVPNSHILNELKANLAKYSTGEMTQGNFEKWLSTWRGGINEWLNSTYDGKPISNTIKADLKNEKDYEKFTALLKGGMVKEALGLLNPGSITGAGFNSRDISYRDVQVSISQKRLADITTQSLSAGAAVVINIDKAGTNSVYMYLDQKNVLIIDGREVNYQVGGVKMLMNASGVTFSLGAFSAGEFDKKKVWGYGADFGAAGNIPIYKFLSACFRLGADIYQASGSTDFSGDANVGAGFTLAPKVGNIGLEFSANVLWQGPVDKNSNVQQFWKSDVSPSFPLSFTVKNVPLKYFEGDLGIVSIMAQKGREVAGKPPSNVQVILTFH